MAAPEPNYAHRAVYVSAHDGDTVTLRVDFGKLTHGVKLDPELDIRLAGIDTWEIAGVPHPLDPGFIKGHQAAEFTRSRLQAAKVLTVQTIRPDGKALDMEKYGRVLAAVWVDGDLLSDLLRQFGFEKQAVPK